ncbi:MAG: tRNA guanosine(15) transglycosylase TgtA [Thermoplasmata archaeon]|nr:tRNA guanosine(15) transglycosylase TgtA [Thermoplasmata archaeon]
MFELKERSGLARICVLKTKHGSVETPALMPVINPNRELIPPREMRQIGAQIVITNAYILKKSFGETVKGKKLHQLIGFDGPIMTDSGTFQSHVYGDVETTNLEIVDYQREIGSDIGTILDEFVEPDDPFEVAIRKVEETLRRAREAREIAGEMLLSTPVQGGLYPELRKLCAREISMIGDFFPIGGIVPLMENYRFGDLVDAGMSARIHLPASAPVHFFGAGHPMVFGLACLMGADFFDSASYAKYATDNRYMTPTATLHLEELEELPCECPVCNSTTGKELREMEATERARKIALHNLHVCFAEIRRVKCAIRSNELWEYVEERALAHPKLQEGLLRLLRYRKFFERYEAIGGKSFFYRHAVSLHRPAVSRFRRRLFERFFNQRKKQLLVVFPGRQPPYLDRWRANAEKILKLADADFIVPTPFGPLPLELSLVYPAGVAVLPAHPDRDTEAIRNAWMLKLAHSHQYGLAVYWEGEETLKALQMLVERAEETEEFLVRLVKRVCDFQFGVGAGEVLCGGNIEIVCSKNTGRIRNILRDGKHILSMRNDGFLNLKIEGAKLLVGHFRRPKMRCIVSGDSFEFNAKGKNVFAKFVVEMDPDLVPEDEVIVVNEADEVAAIGKVLLTAGEARYFKQGIAVRVRESVGGKDGED